MCTGENAFYSSHAVTAVAEELHKGATIQLLSDMLSFSSRRGSTESPRHLSDAPFLPSTLPSVPRISFFIPQVILFFFLCFFKSVSAL